MSYMAYPSYPSKYKCSILRPEEEFPWAATATLLSHITPPAYIPTSPSNHSVHRNDGNDHHTTNFTRNNPPCNKLLSVVSAWQYTIKSQKLWSSLLCTFHYILSDLGQMFSSDLCSHSSSSVFRDAGIHSYLKKHATLYTHIPAEIPIIHPGYGCQYQRTQHNIWLLPASCWFLPCASSLSLNM